MMISPSAMKQEILFVRQQRKQKRDDFSLNGFFKDQSYRHKYKLCPQTHSNKSLKQ